MGQHRFTPSRCFDAKTNTKSSHTLGYVDDIGVLVRTTKRCTNSSLALAKAAFDMGLQINEKKTEYLNHDQGKSWWLINASSALEI